MGRDIDTVYKVECVIKLQLTRGVLEVLSSCSM